MQGLTAKQAAGQLEKYGPNALAPPPRSHPLRIFFSQFTDIMVLILLAAAVISWFLGETADAAAIAVIVVLNAVLGFVQEYRTEQTLLALRNMSAPTARVFRDGVCITVPAEELVPGDRIALETGDRVPADALICACSQLQAEESLLTGESCAVLKHAHGTGDAAPGNEIGREDILYAGTSVTHGNAEAEIIATGKSTQMGKISTMLSDIDQGETPLQKRLGELGKTVALLCLAVCVLVFGAGVLRGEPVLNMLMTGITIAIAAIPEGLPATVTIALALAVQRMLARNALVNRLHAVETLGCASVICTDKTGTITENKMTVCKLSAGQEEFDLTGTGWGKNGELLQNGRPVSTRKMHTLSALLRCAVLCNHAEIAARPEETEWTVSGDPTEAALLIAGYKCSTARDAFSRTQILSEIPFESETRRMTVFCKDGSGNFALSKGAVDVILPCCKYYRQDGRDLPLTPDIRAAVTCTADRWAEDALRVLAFAEQKDSAQTQPQEMVFLGLCGMLDPPREQARHAVQECNRAGIRVVMLTGDHAKTAAAIARRAGIPHSERAVTGAELDRMDDAALRKTLRNCSVFARVTPAHKLRLVKTFRAQNQICAMTGDGVNDAPAVKEADIGVAMGKNGTDVTRQAADLVLLDDRFDTLTAAVEQGRTVYANIRKFVRYLLACNIGEVLTMFAGILMGLPVVLLPTQILLVNLMTDGLPAVALGLEPPAPDTMRKPPRRAGESFFSGGLLSKIIFRGIFIALSTLGSFTTILRMSSSLNAARTGALLTLIFSQLLHVFECKNENGTLFSVRYFSNGKLILAVLTSLAVTLAAIWLPALQRVFSTVALPREQLLAALAYSLAVPVVSAVASALTAHSREPIPQPIHR